MRECKQLEEDTCRATFLSRRQVVHKFHSRQTLFKRRGNLTLTVATWLLSVSLFRGALLHLHGILGIPRTNRQSRAWCTHTHTPLCTPSSCNPAYRAPLPKGVGLFGSICCPYYPYYQATRNPTLPYHLRHYATAQLLYASRQGGCVEGPGHPGGQEGCMLHELPRSRSRRRVYNHNKNTEAGDTHMPEGTHIPGLQGKGCSASHMDRLQAAGCHHQRPTACAFP